MPEATREKGRKRTFKKDEDQKELLPQLYTSRSSNLTENHYKRSGGNHLYTLSANISLHNKLTLLLRFGKRALSLEL